MFTADTDVAGIEGDQALSSDIGRLTRFDIPKRAKLRLRGLEVADAVRLECAEARHAQPSDTCTQTTADSDPWPCRTPKRSDASKLTTTKTSPKKLGHNQSHHARPPRAPATAGQRASQPAAATIQIPKKMPNKALYLTAIPIALHTGR